MRKLFAKANLSFMIALQMIVLPIVICLIVVIVLMGQKMNSTYGDAEKLFYENLYTINSKLVNADRDLYQSMNAARQYMSVHDAGAALDPDSAKALLDEKEGDYNDNLDQTLERVNAAVEIAKKDPHLYSEIKLDGKSFKDYADQFQSDLDVWLGVFDYKTQEGDLSQFNEQFEITRDSISNMTDIVEQWAEEEKAAAKKDIASKVTTISIILGAIIVVLYIVVLCTAKALSDGVKRVEKGINNMAEGDFVTHLETESPIKEFRQIAGAAEDMRHQLHEALKKIVIGAETVDEGASTAKERITDSQRATADINQAVSDLANGATAMATDVQSTAGITVNIGNAVEEVLEAANSNLDKGSSVMEESTSVKDQLGGLVSSGDNTRQKAIRVSESVEETAAVVTQISQAAELIISIANQTNLLALNASIEAARAGEAGKGFAVVADNIKDLAEESNGAANEISGMLTKITSLSDQNKELTDEIRKATEDEAVALTNMSDSFEKMLSMLKETEEGNNKIVSLVETLENNKNKILESVESLSSVSEENAASTEETSASLSMLDTNMEDVVNQAETLKNVAVDLRENVKMFTI